MGHWILLALALVPVPLAAQASFVTAPVDSGTLVRITPATGAPIRGRLLETFDPGSPALRFCHYPAPECRAPGDSIASHLVTHLEIQRGNQLVSGAVIGGLIGGVFGVLIGSLAQSLCDSSGCGPTPVEGGVLFALGGAAVGGIIATAFPRWEPAP